ncbi:elastin-like [Antechinus flavipes]|uniref:elastin-like n=1 Tax=Antechinus flavipes TaxID=38775 RepID=UPI002236B96A|nr:elastin-like [Antechinus flavipes]
MGVGGNGSFLGNGSSLSFFWTSAAVVYTPGNPLRPAPRSSVPGGGGWGGGVGGTGTVPSGGSGPGSALGARGPGGGPGREAGPNQPQPLNQVGGCGREGGVTSPRNWLRGGPHAPRGQVVSGVRPGALPPWAPGSFAFGRVRPGPVTVSAVALTLGCGCQVLLSSERATAAGAIGAARDAPGALPPPAVSAACLRLWGDRPRLAAACLLRVAAFGTAGSPPSPLSFALNISSPAPASETLILAGLYQSPPQMWEPSGTNKKGGKAQAWIRVL